MQVLLITTYPHSSASSALSNIALWSSIPYIDCISLIKKSEEPLLSTLVTTASVQISNHRIHTYLPDYTNSPSHAPTLTQILQTFQHYPSYDAYAFVNSDTKPLDDKFASSPIKSILNTILLLQSSLFIHRTDISSHSEACNPPSLYKAGFDLFLLSNQILSSLDPYRYKSFKAGQVGWDYALPLSISPRLTYRNSTDLILHPIHPTGSSSSWALAMLNVFNLVHPIRASHLSFFHSVVYSFVSIALKLIPQYILLNCAPILYLLSRVAFYGYLEHQISLIQEITGL